MKKGKRFLFIFAVLALSVISFSFLLQDAAVQVQALNNVEPAERRVYCTATADGNFADDKVIVVMNKQETSRFKNYAPTDFSEYGFSAVEELTKASRDVLKANRTVLGDLRESSPAKINADKFRTILCLTLDSPGRQNVIAAIKKLEQRQEILSASPDYIFHPEIAPNDYYYDGSSYYKQWNLHGAYGIKAPEAWEITKGSYAVKVGIIDTGIQASHPDLAGRVDIALSRDFSKPYPYTVTSVTDSDKHGTAVAGVIAAQGDNGIGISGVCWDGVQVVSLKTGNYNYNSIEEYWESLTSQLILAVSHAAAEGISILNHSYGQDFTGSADQLYAVETAIAGYSGLFVNSAGNKDKDNDANPLRFPSFNLPNFMSVGGIDRYGEKYSSSNWGQNTVDIFAPGANIVTTIPQGKTVSSLEGSTLSDGYGSFNGATSLAAPHVSGVAALLLSVNPELTGEQLKNIILDNADVMDLEVKKSPSTWQTVKRLNAYEALNSVSELKPLPLTPGTVIPAGATVECVVATIGAWNAPQGGHKAFKVSFGDVNNPGQEMFQLVFKEHNNMTGTWELYVWNTNPDNTVQIQLYNAGGFRYDYFNYYANWNTFVFPYAVVVREILPHHNAILGPVPIGLQAGDPAAEADNFYIQAYGPKRQNQIRGDGVTLGESIEVTAPGSRSGSLSGAAETTLSLGEVFYEGSLLNCLSEQLTAGSVQGGGVKLIFSNLITGDEEFQLVYKENNNGTGTNELYIWFKDETVVQLYNAWGQRENASFIFPCSVRITAIVPMGHFVEPDETSRGTEERTDLPAEMALLIGETIYAGGGIFCMAESLSDGNAPTEGRLGFKVFFSDGSQLVLKENNNGTGEWEMYIWFEDDAVYQLYNSSGRRVKESYVFKEDVTIIDIDYFGEGAIGNLAAEAENFCIRPAG